MRQITLDFETYYDPKYSLKKMSTSLYVFDERFKIQGFSIREAGVSTYYSMRTPAQEKKARRAIADIDWSQVLLVGHHLQFDALILTRHFDVKTVGQYICTLSMARPTLTGVIKSHSLNSLADYLGVGHKLDGLEDTKGIVELTEAQDEQLGLYCNEDVRLCEEVFTILEPTISPFERQIIDWHIRAYAEAEFHVDKDRAQQEVDKIEQEKEDLFALVECYLPESLSSKTVAQVLRSSPMFAETLEHNHITVPKKTSPTTGKETYAFAKTDEGFKLLDKGNDVSQLLYESRLKAKSDTALNKAKLLLEFAKNEPMPIYMNYSRAITMRSSGGDKIQAQNFPRGGEARKCLIAPPGHKVISIDSSGIELRMALWFSQQDDKLEIVRNGGDLYVDMASEIYGIPPEQVDKHQRMVGKVLILAAQYGAGINTVHNIMSQGLMGPPIDITLQETAELVTTFRTTFDMVAEMWKVSENFLRVMCLDSRYKSVEYKGIRFEEERAYKQTGMYIHLPNLHVDDEGSFKYIGAQGVETYVYGSKFYNYMVQSQARDVVYHQINEVAKRYKPLMAVHDETTIIVPDSEVEEAEQFLLSTFKTPPSWCSDLPLNAETDIGQYYSK